MRNLNAIPFLFSLSGKLLRRQNLHHVPIEQALSGYNNDVLEPDDIEPAAAFIRACIRLDPKERLSAAELQRHHWIVGQGGVGIARN
jgi:serine/threonine-protein kinase SRPK3